MLPHDWWESVKYSVGVAVAQISDFSFSTEFAKQRPLSTQQRGKEAKSIDTANTAASTAAKWKVFNGRGSDINFRLSDSPFSPFNISRVVQHHNFTTSQLRRSLQCSFLCSFLLSSLCCQLHFSLFILGVFVFAFTVATPTQSGKISQAMGKTIDNSSKVVAHTAQYSTVLITQDVLLSVYGNNRQRTDAATV